MPDTRLSFKDMCARFDVTPRTLRYYEYIELLHPEKDGRSRYYGSREVARMKLILRGRRFGFSLEDIRKWLNIYDNQGSETQLKAWVRRADEQIAVLHEERRKLDESISDLQKLRDEAAESLKQTG